MRSLLLNATLTCSKEDKGRNQAKMCKLDELSVNPNPLLHVLQNIWIQQNPSLHSHSMAHFSRWAKLGRRGPCWVMEWLGSYPEPSKSCTTWEVNFERFRVGIHLALILCNIQCTHYTGIKASQQVHVMLTLNRNQQFTLCQETWQLFNLAPQYNYKVYVFTRFIPLHEESYCM